jgi:putative ABC transport system ATP-binding protein
MDVITARGLRKTYSADGSAVLALDGVDIFVPERDYVAIMGPSGCGKSTLLHMLGALDVPDEGEIFVDGQQLSSLSRKELALVRRRRIGFVFQFFNLVPVLTAQENVLLPASLDSVPSSVCVERTDTLLETLGIIDRRHLLPSQLSGGEQQRVAIARALVNEPKVLLADEPTGNLDRTSGAGVMDQLRQLNDSGQTVVLVTHDPAVASQARRVIYMRDGRLVDETQVAERGDTSLVLAKLSELEGRL